MSIEAMKRIKSLLQDGDKIDSHTIPAVVAECDAVILTQQPATGELEPYDAGLLNDFGGGNVEWWQDYIRAELGHAHDFYQSQIATPQPAQATQAEVTDAEIVAVMRDGNNCNYNDEAEHIQFARAILAMHTATQPCGHPASLVIRSAESGEVLYCEACDDKSGRRDAEMREGELLEANQKLRDEILSLRPERGEMTGEQWTDVLGSAGPDLLDLAKQWSDNKVHVYQVVNEAEKIVKAAVLRGITAQAKKEAP